MAAITKIGAESCLRFSKCRMISTVERGHLVGILEAKGIPLKHAEAIVSAVTLVLEQNLETTSHNLISKAMQKIELSQVRELSKFKYEILKSQDRFSMLQHDRLKLIHSVQHELKKLQYDSQQETEKIGYDIEKVHSELRSEIEKAIAEQCLETSNLENKIAGQIHAVRDKLKVAKHYVLKFLIGSVVSISAAFIGIHRLYYNNK